MAYSLTDAEKYSSLPMSYIKGADISSNAVAGVYSCVDIGGKAAFGRAAISRVDGDLVVRMINDRSSAVDVWTTIPIMGDKKLSGIGVFDKINVTSSTADLFVAGNLLVGI